MGVDVAKLLSGKALPETSTESVQPNELVRKLMAREAPAEILPFPRNGIDGKALFDYRMRVLTQFELDACTVDAERYTRKQFLDKKTPGDEDLGAVKGEAWTEVFSNSKVVEVLQRACTQPEMKKNDSGIGYYPPLFQGCQQIRKLLTSDELGSLGDAYLNVQFKFGKLFRLMSADEVDEVVNQLEKGIDSYPLSHLEPGQLIVLVCSLAARNRALRIDTGSSGGPAESGTDETLIKMDGE